MSGKPTSLICIDFNDGFFFYNNKLVGFQDLSCITLDCFGTVSYLSVMQQNEQHLLIGRRILSPTCNFF